MVLEQLGKTGGLHVGIEGVLNGDVRSLGTLVFAEMADNLGDEPGILGTMLQHLDRATVIPPGKAGTAQAHGDVQGVCVFL
jgi:hypothetical protein